MSVKKNDNAILLLQKKVDAKREALSKAQRFVPITNCSIELHGERYNIQTLGKDKLIHLLVMVHAYTYSANALALYGEYRISGYLGGEWITDLEAKLAYLNRKVEGEKLKLMEAKLNQLLSAEKQVELTLDKLADELDSM